MIITRTKKYDLYSKLREGGYLEKKGRAKETSNSQDGRKRGHGSAPSLPLDFGTVSTDRSGNIYVTVSDPNSNAFTMKYDQTGGRLWFAREDFLPAAMVVDSKGNVCVAGSRLGEDSGYSGSVITKYDTAGRKIWSASSSRYQGGIKKAHAAAVDGIGNVYVTGFNFHDGYSYVTIKYDVRGNLLWRVRHQSRHQEKIGMAVSVDNSGNVYVAGSHVTMKYDSEGRKLWEADFGGSGLALDHYGDVYVSGYFPDWEGIETRKYDTDGNQIWSDSHNQTGHIIRPSVVNLDHEGSVYVCAPLDILKYNAEGVRLWTIAEGGIEAGLDRAGNVYTTLVREGQYNTVKYIQLTAQSAK